MVKDLFRTSASRGAIALLLTLGAVSIHAGMAAEQGFDDAGYAAALRHVDDTGMVDYAGLKADRAALDAVVATIGALDRATFDAWDREAQLAFLANAYNAFTLRLIVDEYPISPGLLRDPRYPANSIRQIGGAWTEDRFTLFGEPVSLDTLEHKIMRERYDHDARIHIALVCAANGCPPLRNEPFTGERFEEQIAGQAARFFADKRKFRIDDEGRRLLVSPILDWFGEDFARSRDRALGVEGSTVAEGILWFVERYGPADFSAERHAGYKIEYLDYDWTLNERK